MAGFFDTLFGGGAEKEAADKNRQLAAQYQTNALSALGTTYGEGTTALNKGIAAYDPLMSLASKYGKAGDLYLDALGVNGPEGTARAQSSFTTTPGYTISQNEALKAIDARRALAGGWNSGNTDTDIGKSITGMLYNTQYAPWMAGLQGAGVQGGQYATTAAGGQAGGYTNLANLASQYGQNQTNVYGTTTSGMMDANKLQASGEAAGAKNLLGMGLGLLSAAMPGGGSLFGNMLTGGGNMIGQMLAPKGGYTGFTGG